jgi:ribosome-binding factor A
VTSAPDLRHARVFVSILGTDAERHSTFEALESLSVHLRSHLARTLRLRVAPEVAFKMDETYQRAQRIESLLAQIRQEQPKADAEADPDSRSTDDRDAGSR